MDLAKTTVWAKLLSPAQASRMKRSPSFTCSDVILKSSRCEHNSHLIMFDNLVVQNLWEMPSKMMAFSKVKLSRLSAPWNASLCLIASAHSQKRKEPVSTANLCYAMCPKTTRQYHLQYYCLRISPCRQLRPATSSGRASGYPPLTKTCKRMTEQRS